MRTQLYAALATLRIGMDVLPKDEGVRLDTMFAHGGLFTTKGVAQRFLAAAIDTPVSVGDTASEGGAWGIAVLAAFLARPGSRTRPWPTTWPPGLRRRRTGRGQARPGRRRRLRRLHAALRRGPAGATSRSGPQLTRLTDRPQPAAA